MHVSVESSKRRRKRRNGSSEKSWRCRRRWKMEAALQIVRDGVIRGEGKKKTLDAIKDQMNYRKTVLQQLASAKDWTFSENRKALNEEELKAKLRRLIGGQSEIGGQSDTGGQSVTGGQSDV